MGPRKSKWKVAKNGLPQGGVLAPLLFNVYTNDQPLSTDTRSFTYADDRATLAQGKNKREVEGKLTKCLSELSDYYHANRLKANPGKTVSCMFHLNNLQDAHALELQWNSVKIEHDAGPKYLGVTLDRTLSFKQHCEIFAGKIQSGNNLLSKLANSRWGANPHEMRTTALAMCYSVAEYACPVWLDSTHSKLVDVALSETCRKITGCMKSTSINQLYNLSGTARPWYGGNAMWWPRNRNRRLTHDIHWGERKWVERNGSNRPPVPWVESSPFWNWVEWTWVDLEKCQVQGRQHIDFDPIRPQPIRPKLFDQKGRPNSFRPISFDPFHAIHPLYGALP